MATNKQRSYYFTVSDEVPEEFRPLMAAYNSYHLRTTNTKHCNQSAEIKSVNGMIWRLLTFLYNPDEATQKKWRRKKKEERCQMIIEKVTDLDDEIMEANEQLKLFAEIASENREIVVAYLFKENDPKPIYRTDDEQSGEINIPVIRYNNGKYAATSVDNIYCQDKNKFCYSCNKEYQNDIRHMGECRQRCKCCMRMGRNMPCKNILSWEDRLNCDSCLISFRNPDCFQKHLEKACKYRKRCLKCNQIYNTADKRHQCGMIFCRECKGVHPKNRKATGEFYCFINKAKINKNKDFAPQLIIAFDFESIQNLRISIAKKRPYSFDEYEPCGSSSQESCSQESAANTSFECADNLFVPDAHPHHNEVQDHNIYFDRPDQADLPENAAKYIESDNFGIGHIRESEWEKDFTKIGKEDILPAQDNKLHQVNAASCLVKCSDCLYNTDLTKSCPRCPNKIFTWTSVPNPKEGVTYCDPNKDELPLDGFRDFIIDLSNRGLASQIILLGHNAARYDSHLLCRSMAKIGYAANIIFRGLSIIQAVHKANGGIGCKIIIRDSYRIIPIRLGKFAECFNLEEGIGKMDLFPYLYNNPKFYCSELFTLPEKRFYNYSSLTKKAQIEFDKKYDEENYKMIMENRKFVFVDELINYLEMDVITLYRGYVEYAKILNELVQKEIEPFKEKKLPAGHDISYFNVVTKGCTLASLAMYLLRLCYWEDGVLGLTQEAGYSHCSQQSKVAIKYLDWLAAKENIDILHRDNSVCGEIKIGEFNPISIDGWCLSTNTIYEVYGCRYHGCLKCYKILSTVLFDGKTVAEVRARDAARMERLKRNFEGTIEIIWECEINLMLQKDSDMKKFFDNAPDTTPINLRSCLQGGRCAPFQLSAEAIPNRSEIKHFDVNSLYPYSMFVTDLPVGHPIVHTRMPLWKTPEEVPPVALIKARVVCPFNLRFPILSVKYKNQMIFPSCYTCMITHDEKNNYQKPTCNHNQDQRELTVECSSIELIYAMKKSYQLLEVLHCLEFPESSKNLFREYLRVFISMKVHASVPPANFDDPEVQKAFVDEYWELYGIPIYPEKMGFNSGKRFIAKIYNNSIWGRLCLRAGSSDKQSITANEFMDYQRDRTIYDLTPPYEIEKDVLLVNFKKNENYMFTSNTNLPAAIFITAASRLWLIKFIYKVIAAGGTILYCDTDSIIFIMPWGADILGAGGRILGEMVDEQKGNLIRAFRSGGPKNYQLEILKPGDLEPELITKIKGFSNSSKLEEALKDPNVYKYDPNKKVPIEVTNIRPTNDFQIVTSKTIKNFRTIVMKGMIDPETHVIYPYGHDYRFPDMQVVLGPEDSTDVEAILRAS